MFTDSFFNNDEYSFPVCPYWEELVQFSWSNMKKLDLSFADVTDTEFETYLRKCGRYLEEIICKIGAISSLDLISAHCGKIQTIDLTIYSETSIANSYQLALTRLLTRLEHLKSLKLTHNFNGHYDFLEELPDSIQNLSATAVGVQSSQTSIFVSHFHLTLLG